MRTQQPPPPHTHTLVWLADRPTYQPTALHLFLPSRFVDCGLVITPFTKTPSTTTTRRATVEPAPNSRSRSGGGDGGSGDGGCVACVNPWLAVNTTVDSLALKAMEETNDCYGAQHPQAAELLRGPFESVCYVSGLLDTARELAILCAQGAALYPTLSSLSSSAHREVGSVADSSNISSSGGGGALSRAVALMSHVALHKFVELVTDFPVLRVPSTVSARWSREATVAVETLLRVGPAHVGDAMFAKALSVAAERTRRLHHVLWNESTLID
jgi:hypothetical protein